MVSMQDIMRVRFFRTYRENQSPICKLIHIQLTMAYGLKFLRNEEEEYARHCF